VANKAPTKKTAAQLMAEVNAVLGAGSIKLASDPSFIVTFLQTGVLPIDDLLDGGIPRGRFTEIYGAFSTLKSFIGLCLIAQTQEAGGVCGLVDSEHSFDSAWATEIGVNTKELLVERPDTGETAIDKMQILLSKDIDLIVWDSIAATLPKAEAKQRMGSDKTTQPARQAAMMSEGMRKLNTTNDKTAVLAINQTRSKVGIVFGSPESVPGGHAMPFYASYRIAMRKGGKITMDRKSWDGEKEVTVHDTVGQKIRCELLKSKLSSPDREVWFTWDLKNNRVDEVGYLITWGLENGLISYTAPPKGAKTWKMKGSTKTWRGDAAFRGYLDSNPKARYRLKSAVLAGIESRGRSKGA
jgi:recombination protein RecA